MRILYVMDPLERMLVDKDTTFAFMHAAQRAGHENLHCLPHQLSIEDGTVYASSRQAIIVEQPLSARYGRTQEIALHEVEAVLVRKDPPFDAAYLYATLMLDLAKHRTFIMNAPGALRDANEKLYALQFPEWTPRTYVSADATRIRAFVDAVGGRAVIKPLDGAGGFGVMLLTSDGMNASAIIGMLTLEGTKCAIVQEYLPAVREGDKRVLLLDGRLLGAVLRVPQGDDLRANIHVGGRVVACDVSNEERQMVADVGPRLRDAGLYFVGLDVIGGRLTEVNVTSPTGIQELARLTGTSPADEVISWLEKTAASFRKSRN